jgi:hypothetical protein
MFDVQDISREFLRQIQEGLFDLQEFAQLTQEKVIEREKMLAEE